MAIALRLEGFTVVEASGRAEVLKALVAGPVDLALVDAWLGPERGDELLEEIGELSPGTRLVEITGQSGGSCCSLAAEGRARHLEKPLQPADVIKLLA